MKLSSCALAIFLASSASVTSSQNIRQQRKVGEILDLSGLNDGLFRDEKKSKGGSKKSKGTTTTTTTTSTTTTTTKQCPLLTKVELEPDNCTYTVGDKEFVSIPNGLNCPGRLARAALAVSGNNNIIDCHGGNIVGGSGDIIGVLFTGTNNVIQNCNVSDFFPGMKVEFGATVKVLNASSNSNIQAGLVVDAGGVALIQNSKFQNNLGSGVYAEAYSFGSPARLTVMGDETIISGNADSGLGLNGLVTAHLIGIDVSGNARNLRIREGLGFVPTITMIDVKACDATSGEDINDETTTTIAEGVTCNMALDAFEGTEIECYCDKMCPT